MVTTERINGLSQAEERQGIHIRGRAGSKAKKAENTELEKCFGHIVKVLEVKACRRICCVR